MKKFSKLENSQKVFIENKVKKLKTIKSVKTFYDKKCLVDQYALYIAGKLNLPKGRELIK
jgi:hypothetical protein